MTNERLKARRIRVTQVIQELTASKDPGKLANIHLANVRQGIKITRNDRKGK
jgi:hypothetical protein